MAEDKYAQIVVEQCFDLLKRFFDTTDGSELFISDRALTMLLKRVEDHLSTAFGSGSELAVFRQLRDKLGTVRRDMLQSSKSQRVTGNIFTSQMAGELLTKWCKAPEFESEGQNEGSGHS